MSNKNIKVVEERWKFIEKHVKDKIVLDVGCAELIATTKDFQKKERWLFEKIRKVAKELMGLEINKEQVELLRKLGYNIILGDVETTKINQKFDVIFAGELIEHLSNPGLFIENMGQHLFDNGILVITTPNRFDSFEFLRALLRNKIPQYKKEIAAHVLHFDMNSLEALAERCGFQLIDSCYYWTFGRFYDSFIKRIILKIIARLRPQFVRGIIMVFRKKHHEL